MDIIRNRLETRYQYLLLYFYRGTETKEVIDKRIAAASNEIAKSKELAVYTELINDNLDVTQEKFIIYLKEFYPELKW